MREDLKSIYEIARAIHERYGGGKHYDEHGEMLRDITEALRFERIRAARIDEARQGAESQFNRVYRAFGD